MKVLVSGAASGLGRSLKERFGAAGLTRETTQAEWDRLRRDGVDAVIHCAGPSRRGVDAAALGAYLDDSLLLTERLVAIPHERFVFLSSVDVYPKGPGARREDDVLMADQAAGLSPMTKLMGEAVVAGRAKKPLILRASALLGPHARRNSLVRILEDEPCELTLSGDSSFNYVLHEDVGDFIALALERGLSGVYNAASAGNVTLAEIAKRWGREVSFGKHRYDAGTIDNAKIAKVCPAFKRTSLETVERFARSRAEAR